MPLLRPRSTADGPSGDASGRAVSLTARPPLVALAPQAMAAAVATLAAGPARLQQPQAIGSYSSAAPQGQQAMAAAGGGGGGRLRGMAALVAERPELLARVNGMSPDQFVAAWEEHARAFK